MFICEKAQNTRSNKNIIILLVFCIRFPKCHFSEASLFRIHPKIWGVILALLSRSRKNYRDYRLQSTSRELTRPTISATQAPTTRIPTFRNCTRPRTGPAWHATRSTVFQNVISILQTVQSTIHHLRSTCCLTILTHFFAFRWYDDACEKLSGVRLRDIGMSILLVAECNIALSYAKCCYKIH